MERDDVGCLIFLSGNWGGSKKGHQHHVDNDLKRSLASIMFLQAQPKLVEVLSTAAVVAQRGRNEDELQK